MQERTLRVNTKKLQQLSAVYKMTGVAARLGISKQRFHHYVIGKYDMPESILDRLCSEFQLNRAELER